LATYRQYTPTHNTTPTQEKVSNTKNEKQNKTIHNATEPTNNQSQKKETEQLKTTTFEGTIEDNTETVEDNENNDPEEETMTTLNIHKSPENSYPYSETTSIGNSCKSLPSDDNVDHANETNTSIPQKKWTISPT